MTTKLCLTCDEHKPLDQFHTCRRQGNQSRCKACRKKLAADKYSSDPAHRARLRRGHYLYRYGVTFDEIVALRELQKGRCAVCDAKLKGGLKEHVDHCHRTGLIRGILCSECNTGIGKLKDNPALLRRAAEYLEAKA